MKTLKNLMILCVAILLFASCEEDGPQILNPGPQFSLDLFEQNIIDAMNFAPLNPVGWGYVINQNGNAVRNGAFGDARTEADKQMDFTINKEVNVASITKFYTAVAAMQLLDANNLTIHSKIEPYLPDSWVKGPGVDELTFGQLMRHRSGLQSTNNNFTQTLGYEGLKTCIQTGVVNDTASYNYLNVNFALFRVLIPSLWSELPNPPAINIESDANTQFMYLLYMQQYIWDAIDLPLVGCTPESRSNSTLYYNVADPNSGNNGAYYGDWNPICGGGGNFMTLVEMAKFNAFYEHTEVILSDELKQVIKDNRLGLDRRDGGREIHGSYYSKGGSISNNNAQGTQAQIVFFPGNGVEIAILTNSQGIVYPGGSSRRQMIFDAYNDAWQ